MSSDAGDDDTLIARNISSIINLGTGNNEIYFGGNTSNREQNLIHFNALQSNSDVDDSSGGVTTTGDAWMRNKIYYYDSTHDLFVMDAADFFNRSIVFDDEEIRIKRGKTLTTFVLDDPMAELNDIDDAAVYDLINTPLDSIINKPEGDLNLALDNAQPIQQSNNAIVDGNSKFNNQSVKQKRFYRK